MIGKVQKIRDEVERLRNELIQEREKGFGSDVDDACILELQNVLTYIDSLQEEPVSEDLGEYLYELSKQFPEVSFAKLSRIGVRVAKWQKEQFEKNHSAACDKQTKEEAEIERDFIKGIIVNERRMPTFDDAIKYGMMLQKEQMMKDAIECKVDWYDGFLLDYTQEQQDVVISEIGADVGDKVKVIVIKED